MTIRSMSGYFDESHTPSSISGASSQKTDAQNSIIVISRETLFRECLAHFIGARNESAVVEGFISVADWQLSGQGDLAAPIVLINTAKTNVVSDVAAIMSVAPRALVIVVSEIEDTDYVVKALTCGARAYVPTNATLNELLSALAVVRAGSISVPANLVLATLQEAWKTQTTDRRGTLTERESAVLRMLQLGKSNSVIASELQICTNTVKVHVSRIMKKLNVKNRTEAAYLANTNRLGYRPSPDLAPKERP